MSRRLGWSRGVLALLVAGQLGACGSTPRIPYTASEAAVASVPGMDLSVRAYADASDKTFTEMAARPENKKVPFAYLALSGGGGDGAYGAGILNGWTESGKRPEFSLVSGVSTGALIAPFAFVGPEYDAVLKDIYTSGIASTLVQSPSVTNILFGSGLFGDGRLRGLVRRYVTPELLAAVAAQHAKGRRLLVVTTNLDSQRAVIWNMGAIATNGGPTALDLFADVLTASASIPAVFPPQLLDVQAEGRAFQEMHVDGSVVTPVFTLPQSFILRDGRFKAGAKSDIYVIINGRLEPEFDLAQNNTLSIVERSFTTASRARSRATMATTYAFTRANGIGFNLTYIDESAPNTTAARGFDTSYMRGLYEAGYQAGRTGTFWHKNVPTAPLLKTVAEAR
ncbi:hypothetical protein PMNALOAF_1471 [Methylobacterium adhaesivum]|jgi:hypothetical protein|uniref:Patatin-like phospholipase family protein n=1 Tax=Methylobacterium adhaesivum TaxID=333297 RepID=A0ABT8BK94_9HYPH|nr:patatin-like phospholipase family protein [Methylobacterium adhaesivum]MDN3592623.1 patatin-like phospholipase family protein [Methylobacterium adhaesivum]GJD30227.1 hypothetical protein PMNALOAF_1471 [Methylobacterium adhaesivum]